MRKYLPLLLLLWGMTLPLFSQAPADWTHTFDASIKWSYFDAKTSIYYLHDGKKFNAFDCLSKEVMWSIDASGLKKENLNPFKESPIAWMGNMRSSKKKLMTKRNVLIDKITGEVLFDSDLFEMDKIKTLRVVYDQKLVFVVGKHKKKRVMALAEFGKSTWTWMIDVPVTLKRLSLNAKLKAYPSANKDYLLIHYANDIFTINRKTGAIGWQKNTRAIKLSNYFTKRNFLRTDDPNFYLATKNTNGDFEIMAHDYATGTNQWEQPLLTGRFYNLSGREEDFFIRTNNYFDFIDYKDGLRKSKNIPNLDGNLGKVYLQKEGYLITSYPPKPKGITFDAPTTAPTFYLDWLTTDYQKKWSNSLVLNGKKIERIEKVDEHFLVLTNTELVLIDIENGTIISRETITESPLLAVNSTTQTAMLLDTLTNSLQMMDIASGAIKTIDKRVKFAHRKKQMDRPFSLITVGEHFALIGERNLWVIDQKGVVSHKQYFEKKTSFNWVRTLVSVGGIIGGFVFEDELRQLNYELYKEGLIDPEQFWNNAWAMGVYQKVGAGAVGGDYVSRLIPEKERVAASKFFNGTWIITDKLENRKFGLRLIDIISGEEIKSIWLAKNDQFAFELDFRQKGLYTVKGNTLNFYQF